MPREAVAGAAAEARTVDLLVGVMMERFGSGVRSIVVGVRSLCCVGVRVGVTLLPVFPPAYPSSRSPRARKFAVIATRRSISSAVRLNGCRDPSKKGLRPPGIPWLVVPG